MTVSRGPSTTQAQAFFTSADETPSAGLNGPGHGGDMTGPRHPNSRTMRTPATCATQTPSILQRSDSGSASRRTTIKLELVEVLVGRANGGTRSKTLRRDRRDDPLRAERRTQACGAVLTGPAGGSGDGASGGPQIWLRPRRRNGSLSPRTRPGLLQAAADAQEARAACRGVRMNKPEGVPGPPDRAGEPAFNDCRTADRSPL